MEGNTLDQVYSVKNVNSEHKDLIHDISFDFFGKRFATCSSDQTVKVWSIDENDEWNCTASWKTHSASVWKVTWAHPEFGQVLATCSFDRTAAIWQEMVIENTSTGQPEKRWIHNASLVDSRTSVVDVKFAPKHLGLQLATCSSNGLIRIYEAPDVMNLMHWSLQYHIDCKISCSCVSWNPSPYRYFQPMIAVGSDDQSSNGGGKVFIFEYNDALREWTKVLTIMSVTEPVSDLCISPNNSRKYHVLAVASDDLRIFNLKPISDELSTTESTALKYEEVAHFNQHRCKVVNVTWNVLGTIVLSSGDDGQVFLWMANYLGIWKKVGELKKDSLMSQSDFLSIASDRSETQTTLPQAPDNNRINFRRFTLGRAPPTNRPLEPKFEGAYY